MVNRMKLKILCLIERKKEKVLLSLDETYHLVSCGWLTVIRNFRSLEEFTFSLACLLICSCSSTTAINWRGAITFVSPSEARTMNISSPEVGFYMDNKYHLQWSYQSTEWLPDQAQGWQRTSEWTRSTTTDHLNLATIKFMKILRIMARRHK